MTDNNLGNVSNSYFLSNCTVVQRVLVGTVFTTICSVWKIANLNQYLLNE